MLLYMNESLKIKQENQETPTELDTANKMILDLTEVLDKGNKLTGAAETELTYMILLLEEIHKKVSRSGVELVDLSDTLISLRDIMNRNDMLRIKSA
jgi:hypothetical protein